MSRIKKMSVTNLKAISDLTIDFKGCTAIITGGNNKGKSTFISVFTDRLKGVIPVELLKQGAESGNATIELDNGEKFIWEVGTKNAKKEKLTYITKDELKFPLTAAIAKKFFPVSFDVDKFLNDTPADKNKEVQKLIGLDFTDIDARYSAAFADRTFKNRKKSEVGELLEIDNSIPSEILPTEHLEKKLLGVESHNSKIEGVKERGGLLLQDKINNEVEIKRLESLINDIKDKNLLIDEKLSQGAKWLKAKENQLITPNVVEANKKELQDLKDKNNLILVNNQNILKNEEVKKAFKEWQKSDELVKIIQKEKLDLIKGSELPEGFEFTEDGINYNGKEFSKKQLSSSAIYIGALKLAYMKIGEVKTIHFDASYLDKNSIAEVEQWAKSKDLQLLIERPDFDGGEITYQLISE